MEEYFNLVGGASASASGVYDVKDPATLDIVARAPTSTLADLDDAVSAANAASRGTWANDLSTRRSILAQCASGIETCSDELANVLSQEQGEPLAAAKAEIGIAVRLLTHYAQKDDRKETLRHRPTEYVDVVRAPIGTVGLIVPSDRDPDDEACSSSLGGQHSRYQACTVNAADHAEALCTTRGYSARRGDQYGHRRRRHRPGPRRACWYRQGLLHGLNANRHSCDEQRCTHVEAIDAGAGWERRGDRLP
jgi:hypothetical protein